MTWREPGYYWFKRDNGGWIVVQVEEDEAYVDQGGLVYGSGSEEPYTQKCMPPGVWGPRIEPPE